MSICCFGEAAGDGRFSLVCDGFNQGGMVSKGKIRKMFVEKDGFLRNGDDF